MQSASSFPMCQFHSSSPQKPVTEPNTQTNKCSNTGHLGQNATEGCEDKAIYYDNLIIFLYFKSQNKKLFFTGADEQTLTQCLTLMHTCDKVVLWAVQQ